MWPAVSQNKYFQLLVIAQEIYVVNKRAYITSTNTIDLREDLKCDNSYSYDTMQKRNEWMVDNCTQLIGVFDGSPGGTANCLKYAKNKLKEVDITIINPQFL